MRYISSNHISTTVSLSQAIVEGIPPDGGSYEPLSVKRLPTALFRNLAGMSVRDIAYVVANTLFGEDVDSGELKDIVGKVFAYDMPLVPTAPGRYAMDLTLGPTASYKDIGANFMVQMLRHCVKARGVECPALLVASSGPTARAIVNAVAHEPYDIKLFVLLPHSVIVNTPIDAMAVASEQAADAPSNVSLLSVNGSIEQCRRIVSDALNDADLRQQCAITSANSLNVASYLAEVVIHFVLYAQIVSLGLDPQTVVVSLPSQYHSLLRSSKIAQLMGLPLTRYVMEGTESAVANRDTVVNFVTSRQIAPQYYLPPVPVSPTLAGLRKVLVSQQLHH